MQNDVVIGDLAGMLPDHLNPLPCAAAPCPCTGDPDPVTHAVAYVPNGEALTRWVMVQSLAGAEVDRNVSSA